MTNFETWTPSRRGFLGLAAVATAGAALSACGTAKTGNDKGGDNKGGGGRKGDAGDTLFIAGHQWGPPTSFNPLGGTVSFPCGMGQLQLIYESLVRYNMLDGSFKPGLAKELKDTDDTTIDIPLQDGTKFSDGSELTAADVVFTFEMAKKAALSYAPFWTYVESVTATDDRNVQVKLKKTPYNPDLVKQYLSGTSIFPKAIWEKIDPAKYVSETNMNPIGSGPFKLEKADQTQIICVRNDDYWGKDVFGTPAMKWITHPIFKGNQDGDLKLQSGEIDISQQFTAQIWKMWEGGKPVSTWLKDKPYYLPGNMPAVVINLHKKGLDNPTVRKAMAYAIDYPNIASKAMSEYSDPVKASLVVPSGSEKDYFDEAAVESEGWKYDKEKAIEILEKELQCKKGSDGIYSLPDGTRLGPWKLITPTGWTDWNTACEIVAKSLQAVGIDVQTNFPQAPTMITAMQNGDFDLAHYSFSTLGPATPWARFRDVMDDRGVPDMGKTAFWNYGRYKNPEAVKLLDEASSATDDAAKKDAIKKLDALYRKEIPILPTMYRPVEFYEYNTTNWENFPDEKNPYAPPVFGNAGIFWVFGLKKKG